MLKKYPLFLMMLSILAMSPRRGPVCINLPRNILATSENFKINNKTSYTVVKFRSKVN